MASSKTGRQKSPSPKKMKKLAARLDKRMEARRCANSSRAENAIGILNYVYPRD